MFSRLTGSWIRRSRKFSQRSAKPFSTAILWRLPCRQIRSSDFIARVREREQYLFPKPCRDLVLRKLLAVTVGSSDLLDEPRCTIWEGISAEASIFPESDPIACVHFVFGIDQILQSLHVDFPSGLLHGLGDTQ